MASMQPDEMADVVVLTIKSALAAALGPVMERLAAAEARLAVLGDLRDRVVVVETKSALPTTPVVQAQPVDLQPVVERLRELERHPSMTKDLEDYLRDSLSSLRERIAVVEVRPQLVGPSGEPGPPGKDGVDGKAGLTYLGVFQEGKSYDVGELVTWGGSMWHCNEATESKPGEGSKAWTLIVKRGRDGKDGHP